MMDKKADQSINTNDLPEQVFQEKQIYQHPQPQDEGVPLHREDESGNPADTAGNEKDKTSKVEGLNERHRDDAEGIL